MKEYIAVIAPGHKKFDERVLRTVRKYSEHINVIYVHEKNSSFDDVEMTNEGFEIINVQFPFPGESGLFARYKKIAALKEKLNSFNVIGYHVHESGTFGLNISANLPRNRKIIFDYHDWIPFEIYEKVGGGILYKMIYLFFRTIYIKAILKKLEAVVFISDGAKDYFNKFYGKINSFVVPNSRQKLEIISKEKNIPNSNLENNMEQIELLWVGNIMPLRQIERLFEIRDYLISKNNELIVKISIWGRIKDHDYAKKIRDIEKNSLRRFEESFLTFNGEYKKETEIRTLKNYLTFGFSFGWNDEINTGLNKIACPTKMYSYGLIRIIGFLESKCEDQNAKLKKSNLDLGFSNNEEACSKILNYMYNPKTYMADARKLYQFCLDQNIESEKKVDETVTFMLKNI